MSNQKNIISPRQLIAQIESKYNVASITVDNLPVWQFLRNLIYSKKSMNKAPSKKTIKSLFRHIKRGNYNEGQFDYILFTDSRELILTQNNKYIDKISQSIIDILNQELLVVVNPLGRLQSSIQNNDNMMLASYFHLKRRTFILNKKYVIKNELELKKIFDTVGFEYYQYIKLFFIYHTIFDKWLDIVKPKVVFINCGYSLFHQSLIYACNIKGVKTVELQHGLISEGHIQYSPSINVGQETFPEYLLTFSDYYFKFINTCFIPPSNMQSVGHYYREKKIQQRNLACEKLLSRLRNKYKKIILVSSQDIIEKDLINSVQKIADLRPNYCFIFKQRVSSGLNLHRDNIIVDEKYNIYDFISLVDCVLSCFSTSVVEFLSNKTIGVLMDFSNLASEYYGQIKKECNTIFICKTNQDAIAALDLEIDNYQAPSFYVNNNKQNIATFLKRLS